MNIEFLGGPFDGHRQVSSPLSQDLPVRLVWLVCDGAFEELNGRISPRHGQLTSVAFYDLERHASRVRYRYFGSLSSHDFNEALCASNR